MKSTVTFAVTLLMAIACAVVPKIFIASGRTFQTSLIHSIDQRAQLNLFENFQNGLDAWESSRPIARTWSYDSSGLVVPGDLSFFKPSMHLTDYDVETWAEVVKGFTLVFRAGGPRTYHAVRFMAQGSRAAAYIAAERYTVMNGHESVRTYIHCPIPIRKDELCRIRLQAQGDSFTLYVHEQLVDHWSDVRLNSGGVGLFCAAGERVRIVWMRVSHQTDLTGKLCAFVLSLSPAVIRE